MCPPKPESLIDAIRKLQKEIGKESVLKRKEFLNKHTQRLTESCGMLTDEINVTKLGVL